MLRVLPPAGHPIKLTTIFTALSTKRAGPAFFDHWDPRPDFLLTSSGTSALYVSFLALKRISNKKEVIIPAYTCPSLISAAIKADLRPVLCDLKKNCFEMELNQLESKISPDTLAVVGVHLFGIPENIYEIKKLLIEKGIFLIEDASQAFGNFVTKDGEGSTSKRRMLGSLGDLGIISFGRGKPLSTLKGGAIIINNPEIIKAISIVSAQYLKKNGTFSEFQNIMNLILYSIFFHPRLYWFPQKLPFLKIGETIFKKEFPVKKMGRNAIKLGSFLLRKFDDIHGIRIKLSNKYITAFSPYPEQFDFLPSLENSNIAFNRFPLMLENKKERDNKLNDLKKLGLGATEMYPSPLNEIAGLDYLKNEKFPNSKSISEAILTLPLHEYVTERDISKMIEVITHNKS